MLLGEVVDELLDEDRLADAGATEEPRLAAADVGLEKVDGLDARLEDLGLGGQVLECRGRVVNRVVLHVIRDGLAVDRLPHDVPDTTERGRADGHHHRSTGVMDAQASLEAVGRRHGDGADDAVGKLRLDLEDGLDLTHGRLVVDDEGGVDGRHVVVEVHVDDRANDAGDLARAYRPVQLLVRSLLEGASHLFWHF